MNLCWYLCTCTQLILILPKFMWEISTFRNENGQKNIKPLTQATFKKIYESALNWRDAAVNPPGIRYRETIFASGEKFMTTKSWKRHYSVEESARNLKRKRIKTERLQGIGKSNHGKRKHQRKTVAAADRCQNVKKIHKKSFERRILNNVLRELKTEIKSVEEDGCGTHWTKTASEQRSSKFRNFKTYGAVRDMSSFVDYRNRRHVTDVRNDEKSSAIYFSGGSCLRWSRTSIRDETTISRAEFTVELWIKPEGGQQSPAVILEVSESCENHSTNEFEDHLADDDVGGRSSDDQLTETKVYENAIIGSDWNIGITSTAEGGDRKAVYYVKLFENAHGQQEYIYSISPYMPGEWTHIAVSHDGKATRLYKNGVQVGVTANGRPVPPHVRTQCTELFLGGNRDSSESFRGLADKLTLWRVARSQANIKTDMYEYEQATSVVFQEDFEEDFKNWEVMGRRVLPTKIRETVPSETDLIYFPELQTPECGQTICDNPDIIKSYVTNWNLRKPKTLRYHIVSVNENDGTNPMLTLEDVQIQNNFLRQVFEKHNITWIPTLVNKNDSSLRHKTIGCEPTKIGNRECNRECMHAGLGHDGGDCDADESFCEPSQKGNGHCDSECNKIYHGWDDGDCCNMEVTDTDKTCFDPASPNRAYISVTEYKRQLEADNEKQLTVLFANWTNPNSIGISTFPWDKHAFTSDGGTVVQLKSYSRPQEMSGLVHELGHNLGLLHVHHGLHDVSCDDECFEFKASMTTGDLCEDTNPTPMNTECNEPNVTEDICNMRTFTHTPYTNFMSYADGTCQDNFTPQQRARMHCYIDLLYRNWREETKPVSIPLAPKVVAYSLSKKSITVAWPPPIDGKLVRPDRQCDSRCNVDGSLKQYATTAFSPDASGTTAWSERQATGAPDQNPCTLRGMHFWMPADAEGMTTDCETGCYIDLEFATAVVPATLKVWLTYGVEDGEGVKNIVLFNTDETTITLNPFHAHCDVPLTLRINTNKEVQKIRIYVHYPYTAIDAVEMTSKENNHLCAGCRRIKYKVFRQPPFSEIHYHITTEQQTFTDMSCEDGVTYSYAVQVNVLGEHSELSPPVTFRLGQTFCGDGIIQDVNSEYQREQCDDGNEEGGDGCSKLCSIEYGFHCKGNPSLCYWHEGDGVCEEFEKIKGSSDCFISSPSLEEHWAVKASSSSAALEALYYEQSEGNCAIANETIGPPNSTCSWSNLSNNGGFPLPGYWSPCLARGVPSTNKDNWLKVNFEKRVPVAAVSIYISSIVGHHTDKFTLIILNKSRDITIETENIEVNCDRSPVVIEIPNSRNKPIADEVVIEFSSYDTAIDAVAIWEEKLESSGGPGKICFAQEAFNHANATCISNKGIFSEVRRESSWVNGTTCAVKCDNGYYPKSIHKITCIDGKWSNWAGCEVITCKPPSHLKFAVFSCPNGYQLNSTCTFTCKKQSRIIGNDKTVRCDKTGTWTRSSTYCEPLCSLPPHLAFSTSSCPDLSRRPARPGETCKYRCKVGSHVTKQPLTRRTFRLTCRADGVWTGPGCIPVQCPALPTKYKGLYECTLGRNFGSICTMTCNNGTARIQKDSITCGRNGRWNSNFSLCSVSHTACDHPTIPPGIRIACSGYNIGKFCEAKCHSEPGKSSFDIITKLEMTAGKGNSREPDRKTYVMMCIGHSWSPKPEQLHCIEECRNEFAGDKWCDPINNRAYCNWDGGDCCQSTTNGKKVVPFPSTCKTECECKDPTAIENRRKQPKGTEDSLEIEKSLKEVILVPLNAPESGEVNIKEPRRKRTNNTDGQNHEDNRRRIGRGMIHSTDSAKYRLRKKRRRHREDRKKELNNGHYSTRYSRNRSRQKIRHSDKTMNSENRRLNKRGHRSRNRHGT